MLFLQKIIFFSLLVTSFFCYSNEEQKTLPTEDSSKMILRESSGVNLIHETPAVYSVQNGFVLAAGRFANHEGIIVADLSRWNVRESFCNELTSLEDSRRKSIGSVKKIQGSAILIDTLGPNNYFHWMVQIIPRLFATRRASLEADFYIFPKIEMAFQAQTMELLGLDKSSILCHTEKTLQLSELLVPEITFVPAQGKIIFHPWIRQEWFKALDINEPNKIGAKRIYISRQRSKTRQIVNEEELLEILESFGFKKYFLEELNLKEQAEIFSQSEVIVSPHGAGLANLIFAAPETTVIELFDREHVNRTYAQISKSLGFKYFSFVSKELEDEENFPVYAPITEIQSLLESTLKNL